MRFDQIADALSVFGKAVAERGGDSSGIAATEAFLRAERKTKPADFNKTAKLAVKGGLRLPRATEVRAGAGAQSLGALIEFLVAAGFKRAALKAVSDLRDFFAQQSSTSLEALTEALAEARAGSGGARKATTARRAPAVAKTARGKAPAARKAAPSKPKASKTPAKAPAKAPTRALTRKAAAATPNSVKSTPVKAAAAKAKSPKSTTAKPVRPRKPKA